MDKRHGGMIDYIQSGSIKAESAFIYPIWESETTHPVMGKLSFLYIFDLLTTTEYVVNLKHMDSEKMILDDIIFDIKNIFIYDMKSAFNLKMNFQNVKEMYDADMVKYLQQNEKLEGENTTAHTFFNRKFRDLQKVNNYIPIVKHIEMIRTYRNDFLKYLDNCDLNLVHSFSENFIKSLYGIERNGIMTTTGIEYTQYNPYTLTSRPSNTFNGINYAALKKDDETRSRFVSRFENGKLFQFDYDAYHIRIIADMIKFNLPTDVSAHKLLQTYYGDVTYEEAKGITFRQLYGGVEDQYAHHPFFHRIENFKEIIWEQFQKDGYIETELGRHIKKRHYSDFNKNKLFNYLLQATETEKNLQKVLKINKELEKLQSKLVLYTYDSYLFDVHPDESSVLSKLKILIDDGEYPSKIEVGDDYDNMERFENIG